MTEAKKQHAGLKKRMFGRTARTWFITFVIIFIAQITGWIAATDMVGRRLKIQTDDVYASALNVLSVSYDNCVNSVYSMLDVMTLDDTIKKRCGNVLSAGQNDAYQNELVRRKLASYKLQYPFIDDIFIYFEADEKIISSNTVADTDLFYNIYGNTFMPYEEWKEKLSQAYFKKDVVRENRTKAKTLYIFHTWPKSKQNTLGMVTVAVKFSDAYIQNLVNNFKEDKYSAVTVRNAEGELIVDSGRAEAGNSNRSISRISAFNGWTYTYYVSRAGVKLYEDSILLLLFLCFGSMIVVFTAALIFFYKTNFNPFMELLSYIKEQSPEKQVSGSEYVYIKDKFDEIVKKQRTDELCFINQMNQLKVSHMLQVLKGKAAVDESNRQLFEKMQLAYIYDPCAVVLLSGADNSIQAPQENCMEVAAKYKIGMAQDSSLYGCSFIYETYIICVLRLDADREDMKTKLSALAGTIDKNEHNNILRIAVSSLRGEEHSLSKIYDQAEFVMQSAQQLSVSGILFFDEIQERLKENARDSKCDYLIQQAQEYIESHYANPELTIEMLCSDLGKSVSYLSKIYKEKTGRNLLYDLNLVRIKRAKQLLCESDANIDEIGRRVGFTNSNSFIRVFKKYENVTPGRYKELHMTGFTEENGGGKTDEIF